MNEQGIEIWKGVVGYNGLYEISNKGTVRSLLRESRTSYRPQTLQGKTIKLMVSHFGYHVCSLCDDSYHRQKKVHRLVADAFIPNPENKPLVNHKNGIKTDNKVGNLEWVTYKENSIHSFKMGLSKNKCGVEANNCKLTEEQVLSIRREYKSTNCSQKSLSIKYNVTPQNIASILYNKIWKHLIEV